MPVIRVPPRGSAATAESCPPRKATLPTERKTGGSSLSAAWGTLSQQVRRETEGEERGRRRGLESAAPAVLPEVEGEAEGPARRRQS